MRHERSEAEVYVNYHDEDEEGFISGDSSIHEVPQSPKKTGKGKRSLEDMMASMQNEAAQAAYAMERIAALEDQIAKVLKLCSPEARELILRKRTSLKRYAPDTEE